MRQPIKVNFFSHFFFLGDLHNILKTFLFENSEELEAFHKFKAEKISEGMEV